MMPRHALCAGGVAGGAQVHSSTTWYQGIKVPYEPSQPNDFAEWLKEKDAAKKAAALESALARKREEVSYESSMVSPPIMMLGIVCWLTISDTLLLPHSADCASD